MMTDQQKFTLIAVTLGMICVMLLIATIVVIVLDRDGTLDGMISGMPVVTVQPGMMTPSPAPQQAELTATPEPQSDSTPTLTITPTLTVTIAPSPTSTATPNADGQIALTIGTSVEDRPIEVYRFGSGPNHRLIYAGIHGGYEYNTVDLAYELITYMRGHLELIPPDISLFIVPVLNVDGYTNAPGQYAGRANANGVDLNRNWDLNWAANWDKSGCWNYLPLTGGSAAFSEPETRALADFLLAENIEAVISYHSAALGIFHGGQPDAHPASVSLAQTVAAVSPYSYPGLAYGCSSTGMSAHWAAAQDIAAVDIELTNHSETDFEINLRILNAFLTWQKPAP